MLQIWTETKSVRGFAMISISRGVASSLVLTAAIAFYSIPALAKPAARIALTPERMSELSYAKDGLQDEASDLREIIRQYWSRWVRDRVRPS